MVYDQAFLERIIAACGRVVTSVEGVLTNEVLFQHVTVWSSALRAGLFQSKLPFTAPGKGAQNKQSNNKIDKTKKSNNRKITFYKNIDEFEKSREQFKTYTILDM